MDNTIKVWSLDAYRDVLEESDAWQGGGTCAFPTRHVPRPTFSTEVPALQQQLLLLCTAHCPHSPPVCCDAQGRMLRML